MPMPSRFGRQPARDILDARQLSIRETARALDIPLPHLTRALNGQVPPSPRVRELLPRHLQRSIRSLFTKDALNARYKPSWGEGTGAR